MNKEEFKNYVNEIAKNELRNSFDNNLMETLNSAFIFKYVETLEKENKELKEVINKAIEYIDDWLFNVGGMGACMDYKDIKEILDILKEVE